MVDHHRPGTSYNQEPWRRGDRGHKPDGAAIKAALIGEIGDLLTRKMEEQGSQ